MALNITINKASVAASFAAGATVATAVASGGTAPYVYSLATGGDKFAINSSTGVVTTIAAMDITNIASFSVTATDSTTGTALTITSDVIYPPIQAAIRSKFDRTNVIYKITKDIDLGHGVLTIPKGCTLDFQGGSFTNGTIVGTNSDIRADEHVTIFKGIVIEGTWKVKEISSGWFNFVQTVGYNNLQNFNNLFALTSGSFRGTVNIDGDTYYITISNRDTDFISINDNTIVNLSGTIRLNPNNLNNYEIVKIVGKNNITIQGGGTIYGDVEGHTGTTGEWGMGITILDGNGITIKGITVRNCWGDGIYIGQTENTVNNYPINILIDNVTVTNNRRQGISITSVQNLTIRNCRVLNTGAIKFTAPGAGIDIEPNIANAMLENINIEGCYFAGNTKGDSGDLLITALIFGSEVNTTFKATISNCYFSTKVRLTSSIRNLTITNSYIGLLDLARTGSHYYKTMISGCLINGTTLDMNNPGILYSGCSFINERGSEQRRVFSIGNTVETPVTKITFPKVDGLINLKIFTGYNAANYYCVNDIVIKGRYINENNNLMSKAHTIVYDDTGSGNIDLERYKNNSILVSEPIKASDGSWEIYLKTFANNYFTGIIVIEPIIYTAFKSPFFTSVDISFINAAPVEANFKVTLSQPCHGSTDTINSIMDPKAGVVVYNDTLNKVVFGNGTSWIDATGATV